MRHQICGRPGTVAPT